MLPPDPVRTMTYEMSPTPEGGLMQRVARLEAQVALLHSMVSAMVKTAHTHAPLNHG